MAGAKLAKPRVFIGSSGPAYGLAMKVARALKDTAVPDVWKGSLEPTRTLFDGLVAKANEVDFAVFVFQPDDLIERHDGKTDLVVRDNVLFEFGLFLGVLGRERTFAIMPQGAHSALPSDLGGVLFATFDNLLQDQAQAIAIACDDIVTRIEARGQRDHSPEFFADLQAASPAIVRSLAESAAPQLEVIASTAGAVYPNVLEQKLPGNLRLTVHLVNPDSPLNSILPGHWPDNGRTFLQNLKGLARKRPRWSVDCWLYDHIPCVHGFMIDRQELFIGFYRWEKTGDETELVGAQAPYRRFRRNAATEDHFLLFESWLNSPTAKQHKFD